MATQSTYNGVTPRTIIAGDVAIARGLRTVINTSGFHDLAGIGVRGDFIAMTDIEATKPGPAVVPQAGNKIPMVASEQTAVGDPAYSAALGKTSKTTGGGAVYLGKWTQAASGDGVLGEVELQNPA